MLCRCRVADRDGAWVATRQVGSGKSSFLDGVLGELTTVTGNVSITGTVAYVPQEVGGAVAVVSALLHRPHTNVWSRLPAQAWIRSATVRDNILAGMPLDRDWYNRVVTACALRTDLASLPAGDLSQIGERGVTLSGGQRARVRYGAGVPAVSCRTVLTTCMGCLVTVWHERSIATRMCTCWTIR